MAIVLTLNDYLQAKEKTAQLAYYQEQGISPVTSPVSSSDTEGLNYREVIDILTRAGFTNVSAIKSTPDFIDRMRFDYDETLKVCVDGELIRKNNTYASNAPVFVYYYSE